MSILNNRFAIHGEDLHADDIERLQLLISDWQVLADVGIADLVLWLPSPDGRFVAVAHCRPSTGATVHLDDVVGLYTSTKRARLLHDAMQLQRVTSAGEPRWAGSYTVQEVAVPVIHQGRPIAVITREMNVSAVRLAISTETWFIPLADALSQMITQGQYPYDSMPASTGHGMPRVNDGVVQIDENGIVEEITPNASSCFRRLGLRRDLVGQCLVEEVTKVLTDAASVEETMAVVTMGRAAWRTEIEAFGVTITLRALPLIENGRRRGAILLCRDVSESRRRERELMTKDATIREIHHRVKNNLQTVSALLRLQGRRSSSAEVKAALTEADRRVATIAAVHEELSHNVDEAVDFDQVAQRIVQMGALVASSEGEVRALVSGEFGRVCADAAFALSVVLTELVANAVEHGLAGKGGVVEVKATREGNFARICVCDNGVGIVPGRVMQGLGTQIVQTLVSNELAGSIEWIPNPTKGTEVVIHARVDHDAIGDSA